MLLARAAFSTTPGKSASLIPQAQHGAVELDAELARSSLTLVAGAGYPERTREVEARILVHGDLSDGV
jgi:hypothetical protein